VLWVPGARAQVDRIVGGGGIATTATFFVSNTSSACSDAGPGTQAQPYCSITAALAAHHDPGTRILVAPGRYRAQLTLPASGASGGNPASHAAQVGHRLYGFFVSGKAWVTITGFDVTRCEDRCIQLTNSSNLDVTGNRLTSAGKFGLQASADSVVHIASNVSSD